MINALLEKNLLPDWLIRFGIRRLLALRLREEDKGSPERNEAHLLSLIEELRQSPVAIHTADANNQHYQVPTEFYKYALGRHLKYSGGYWPGGVDTLDASEEAMLKLTAERARLANGQDILELGCGWGSLSLYMAERFPGSRITGVSNSKTQKIHIDGEAARRGLKNLVIITADMNEFDAKNTFDRIVSVEMFEHMRNYETLLARISSWMKPGALLFVHIFTHLRFAYPFTDRDETDWMARYFFTGGIMPSDSLLLHFQRHVGLVEHWQVDGTHYQKTSEAWLDRMDAHRAELMKIFAQTYGGKEALKRWVYWRVFFMACAELFGYRGGKEWIVSHYLFEKKKINRTMDRSDLLAADAKPVVNGINRLIRLAYEKKVPMTSWYGTTLEDEKGTVGADNRGPDYQPLPDAADDARFPWYLYWEIYWVLTSGPALRKDMKVLDAGGTASLFTCYLASLGCEVHSADLKPGLVSQGNAIAQALGWNMRSYVMNLNKLDFPDESFDHAYSICVFEHLDFETKKLALGEIARCLKPGGVLSITFDYRNPAPFVTGKGPDASAENRLSTPEDIRRSFLSTEAFELMGNSEFKDNGKSFLVHPSHRNAPYTFGAVFLRKKQR